MKIFSAWQIKEWDAYTIQHEPITSVNLMERAANACVQWILGQNFHHLFYVFCGSGNNGGDGLAIARLLKEQSIEVEVYILKSEKYSTDFISNLEKLSVKVNYISSENDFPLVQPEGIIIDAMLGTGLNKTLSGVAAQLVQYFNASKSKIISIDIPSGMYADVSSCKNITVKADVVLSFQCQKLAFMMTENLPFLGKVEILPIQLLKDFELKTHTDFNFIDEAIIQSIYKKRKDWVHKYQLGHALIYAGSKWMMGAALLCSKACMRAGAGLVTLHIDDVLTSVLNSAVPEIIASSEKDFSKISERKNVIAFGPGLEVNHTNEQILSTILEQWKGALVIDASGLSILFPFLEKLKNRSEGTTILTPHVGEFDRLFGRQTDDFARMQEAKNQAKKLNCYIVLKAPHTLIACPDGELYFNSTGNSGMATAGSGDVLTGIISGLLAQHYSAKNACILGVYLHGLAGDRAVQKISKEALMATDILNHIGEGYQYISAKQIES
ncbi:MAG: NAD(P)H-hydrate dehydratase [Bacteroidia bacterium]|nr:MAG: NAD(P)H-hydrate dehydratase [Bacteroidia bacterium]